MQKTDVLIVGASASGLMCAIEAAKRGRTVTVIDHANKAGKKILMSGGGRCNFTNYNIENENYICHNPHFVKSALKRFTQWDFIALVEAYNIPYHEREHGQLFCNHSSKDILNLLLSECKKVSVDIRLNINIQGIKKNSDNRFTIQTDIKDFASQSLVIASGGLSIPKMGATPFGYQLAEQFNIKVWPTSSGLVPFTLHKHDKDIFSDLSGIAVNSIVKVNNMNFRENILFTHRGLSGPAILQISSYWDTGESIEINLLPDLELLEELTHATKNQPQIKLKTLLYKFLAKRLINIFVEPELLDKPLQELSNKQCQEVSDALQKWIIIPNGTEGYRTAEVTIGGVDCDELSSKTFETKSISGLYFIGEVMDVSGWLGGYNFQWSWSSGWCAGQYV